MMKTISSNSYDPLEGQYLNLVDIETKIFIMAISQATPGHKFLLIYVLRVLSNSLDI